MSKETKKILEELIGSKPEELTGEAKRLFEAIMKIADERDELEYKYNRAIEDLIKLEKERQADKEKIKEYAELLIKVNVQNLNNSIEQRKESNEQLEALHEGWKIELEKKDNRIKELESDKEIKDKMIELIVDFITELKPAHFKKEKGGELVGEYRCYNKNEWKQYFENKAKVNLQSNKENIDTRDFKQKYQCEWNLKSNKESGEIDECR